MHKSFFATSTMPECAFAELDRVVRKCLLSSLNSFADVVVFVVVVVNREREVLPGMMRDALRFGRGAAQTLLFYACACMYARVRALECLCF